MRELKLKDVIKFSEIIDQMGLKADLNALFDEAKKSTQSEESRMYFGGQVLMLLMSKIHLAEKPLYEFIGSFNGMTVKDVENMGFAELQKFISDMMEKNGFDSFFKSAVVENK